MPWSMQLFEEAPAPVRGRLTVPSKPGLGLEFDRAVFKRYAVA
jgi:L-alanine-DL-glutamate epimerase-like enolase superfamily enzyme